MSNLFSKFLFALLLLSVACGPKQGEGDAAAAEEPKEETAAPANDASSGEAYTITVVDAEPASQRKEMKGTIGNTTITINYGSPKVKGRQLFGEGGLEPYGEVWRSGANAQTTIEFSSNVRIGATEVPAGKYGLFTEPGEQMWTVIINKDTDNWGDNGYDKSKDVVRVAVKAQTGEHAEELDYMIEGDTIVLRWGDVAVPFKVS
jgi:hypothetical protein